jgi:SAM-dependent methyltransferase
MQILTTLAALDEKLAECSAAASDNALRDVFSSFRMDVSKDVPPDPFGQEYLDVQMAFYQRLAGKAYVPENEVSYLDVQQGARRPFPFSSGNAQLAGEHMIALGFLLRSIQVPQGGRIIEFGAGWGNTSIALAQLGYRVTVVDIEKRFCDVISLRAAQLGLDVEVVHGDFFSAENITEPYDAALFYECFHHCSDHVRLLKALKSAVKPHGRVYFGAEPIVDDFPIPWGVRTDGESLWAIRSNGWLELGFRTDYFVEILRRSGWSAEKRTIADRGWMSVWEATRADVAMTVSFPADDHRLQTQVGAKHGGNIVLERATGGYGLFGPYTSLDTGEWTLRVYFDESVAKSGRALIDVSSDNGTAQLAAVEVDLENVVGGVLELKLSLTRPVSAVEARLVCLRSVSGAISAIDFRREGVVASLASARVMPDVRRRLGAMLRCMLRVARASDTSIGGGRR